MPLNNFDAFVKLSSVTFVVLESGLVVGGLGSSWDNSGTIKTTNKDIKKLLLVYVFFMFYLIFFEYINLLWFL